MGGPNERKGRRKVRDRKGKGWEGIESMEGEGEWEKGEGKLLPQ